MRRPSPARHPGPTAVPLLALYVAYALNATGLVRTWCSSSISSRAAWPGSARRRALLVLFGLGAVVGPMLGAPCGPRRASARAAAGPVAPGRGGGAPALTRPLWLAVSSLVVGASRARHRAARLGRVHELVPDDPEGQRAAWSVTTMAFALGQAAGAYGLSFLFAAGGHYETLFAVGATALMLGLIIDLTAWVAGRKSI